MNKSSMRISTEPVDLGRISADSELKVEFVVPEYMQLENDQPTEVRVKLDPIDETSCGTPLSFQNIPTSLLHKVLRISLSRADGLSFRA